MGWQRRTTAILFITAACGISACSRLSVKSEPAGAQVLWSPNGVTDWRPWPPRAWGEPNDPAPVTPLSDSGGWSDTVWITVEKDGYYAPLPQAAELYPMKTARLKFALEETPQAFATRMRGEGFVYYRGEWVKPQEAGLVEFGGEWMSPADAFAAEQRSKGLVEFEGEWLTPAAREERFAAAQRAKGLVEYKNRWIAPEVRELEERVDAAVQRIAASPYLPLDPPKVIGRIDAEDSQLQLVNATSQPVRMLFSGPMSREVVVDRYQTVPRFHLLPGRYQMAAVSLATEDAPTTSSLEVRVPGMISEERALEPSYLDHPVAEGFKYMLTYTGGRDLKVGDLGTYEPVQPEVPYELPQIEIPDVVIPEPAPRRPGQMPGGTRPPGGSRSN